MLDAEARRSRLEGACAPVHRVEGVRFEGALRFPVERGASESLPVKARDAKAPLGTPVSNLQKREASK